jgi:hypothetical protein
MMIQHRFVLVVLREDTYIGDAPNEVWFRKDSQYMYLPLKRLFKLFSAKEIT